MSGHSHEHHNHHGAKPTYDKAFIIAISANSIFVVLQIVYAYLANSTSLLADAFHNFGDVLGLVIAWFSTGLMKRKPTEKTTYGLKKTSILAALINGMLLVFTCGIIATEAIYKFFAPAEVQAISVMVVAGIGIIVNGATALLFLRGSDDLNIRGAYLHLFYDALKRSRVRQPAMRPASIRPGQYSRHALFKINEIYPLKSSIASISVSRDFLLFSASPFL